MKSIGSWTLEPRTKLFQQISMRQQLVLDFWVKRVKLSFEFRVEQQLPRYVTGMCSKTYAVKHMLGGQRIEAVFWIGWEVAAAMRLWIV